MLNVSYSHTLNGEPFINGSTGRTGASGGRPGLGPGLARHMM